jgi:hypothetical protein
MNQTKDEMGRICSMHGMMMKCLKNLKGRGYLEGPCIEGNIIYRNGSCGNRMGGHGLD